MREAVFTVSPKRQYRGIFSPTTPATTGPAFASAAKQGENAQDSYEKNYRTTKILP